MEKEKVKSLWVKNFKDFAISLTVFEGLYFLFFHKNSLFCGVHLKKSFFLINF